MLDKKAKQILFNTFWSSAGWKSEPKTTPDDFDYAVKAGYMFNAVIMSHDQIVGWVKKVLKENDLRSVSKAFISSLSTRRLDWRSALGSYAIARNFPQHKFSGDRLCDICGEISKPYYPLDLSVLNFERLKWGGVRHLSPIFVAFDLEQFSRLEIPEPTIEDYEIFEAIIEKANNLEGRARPGDLEKAISGIFASNEAERRVLIEILGFCGILQPQNQKGFLESFVNYNEREDRPVNKIDWSYPVSWWLGADGVNKKASAYFFPRDFVNSDH